MSTDLHGRTRQPSPDEGPSQPEKPKSPLSITQVLGGALAAMTAAALGSRLSVAGTVIGAALASVVAAVAGAVYTASLRRTSKHVSAVLTRVRPSGPDTPAASSPAADAPAADVPAADAPTATAGRGADGTWTLPASPATAGEAPARRLRIGWKPALVAALLMFAIAAVALTGIELATGHALSGGSGTTVGQVADPATRPSPTPTHHATATPSATASDSPSAEPSPTEAATPSSGPTASPSSSAGPTATARPSTTPSETPSSTPSASVAPSGAAATP